jgi:hypothetical protein
MVFLQGKGWVLLTHYVPVSSAETLGMWHTLHLNIKYMNTNNVIVLSLHNGKHLVLLKAIYMWEHFDSALVIYTIVLIKVLHSYKYKSSVAGYVTHKTKDSILGQVLVAHACNPSSSGGRVQEDRVSKTPWANSSQDPISKNHHKKRLMEWLKV